eukprot:CAMPEP_0196742918 /NCGR_PEP_ID=MMETSP1091-20130531/49509_1 /TAXON_ID=302021 /ORGANISM="Rhodomonas sp., Strain CCMP768" /LENGTH=81 /DNA_ID=CAMNT_0042089099 /DNA_START=133 /DNA_END=375 /DNA_ORIENTATION=+
MRHPALAHTVLVEPSEPSDSVRPIRSLFKLPAIPCSAAAHLLLATRRWWNGMGHRLFLTCHHAHATYTPATTPAVPSTPFH